MARGPKPVAVRELYDSGAPRFECRYRYARRLFDRIFARAVSYLDLDPGEVVLDVGCGTGRALPTLVAGVGATGQVLGIDVSPGMLRRAAELVHENSWRNVALIESAVELAGLDTTALVSDPGCFCCTGRM